MIRESIVTTRNPDGTAHVAPLGVSVEPPWLVIAPFRPSTTLANLERHPFACINYTTDVRIFAGCVTGRRRDWPTVPATRVPCPRLEAALAHAEVEVAEVLQDPQRPRFRCRELLEATHAPFRGLVRAQAAVVEAAILASRLHLLPADKIDREMAYLEIAIQKTAGDAEREAWGWLVEMLAAAGAASDGAPGHEG